MQQTVETTAKLREGWMTPAQVGDAYSWGLDLLHSSLGIFEALGNATLITGFAALAAIPLAWTLIHLNETRASAG